MNELVTLIDGNAVTTSLAIAEGTENDHASVIKLARAYQADLEAFGPLRFEIQKGKPLPQGGFAKATEYAILNEQQSTLLLTLMRNSEIVVRFKVRLVKAFFDLAQRAKDPMQVLSDPAAMRGLLLTYTEKVIALEGQVGVLAPKAKALDDLTEADGALCLQAAGKALQQKPNKFVAWLREIGWIYRRAGSKNNLGRAEKVNAGFLTHRLRTIHKPDGSQEIHEQVLITAKGMIRLRHLLNTSQNEDLFDDIA